jgi:hypothetical protein
MWGPAVVLAAACIALGLFAVPLAVRPLIGPAVETAVVFAGFWDPTVATALLIVGILLGLAVCLIGRLLPMRESAPFIGGEEAEPRMTLPGTDFYRTITEMGGLRTVYGIAARKGFDIYDLGRDAVLAVSGALRRAHGGVLPVYIGWCLAGLLAVCFFLMR